MGLDHSALWAPSPGPAQVPPVPYGSRAPVTLILVYLLCAVSAPTAPSNLFHYIPDTQHGLL